MTRVLVTCADNPVGRNIVRALVEHADIELFATGASETALARLPFDVRKVVLPATEPRIASSIRERSLIPMSVTKATKTLEADALRQYCVDNGISVVLPALDEMVLALSQHKARFAESGISLPIPDYEVVRRGVDKRSLMACVRAAGLPCIRTICVQTENDIDQIGSLKYPLIAKASIGHGASSVQVYEKPPSNWDALKKALTHGAMLIQE